MLVYFDVVQTVSIALLTDRMGRLSDERMRQVCAAMTVAIDCR